MDKKKALWTGALVAGSAVTLCCVAPIGLIPLALVTAVGGLRGKLNRGRAGKAPPSAAASAASAEAGQILMKASHD